MSVFDPSPEERVEHLFDKQVEVGLHHGAQLAVFKDGEKVVDLAGGEKEPDGKHIETDQKFVLFSCTKPYTAACVHRLVEEGKMGYDDAVVDHWEGFSGGDDGGNFDKDDVTIRHVLSHQGGFPYGEFDLRQDDWTNWDAVVEAMENIDLIFEPGSTAAYHAMNYGWVLGELVRRVSGTPIGDYVREVVFDPLGMEDTHLGLPDGVEDDVATLTAFDEFDRARTPPGLELDNEEAVENFNREEFHRAPMPAVSAVGTASDMARFHACIANGGEIDGTRILEEETVERALETQVEVEQDGVLRVPMRYALGFQKSGTPVNRYGAQSHHGMFGHGGLGSSMAWGDPETRLSFAYVTNGVRDDYEHTSRVSMASDSVLHAYAHA